MNPEDISMIIRASSDDDLHHSQTLSVILNRGVELCKKMSPSEVAKCIRSCGDMKIKNIEFRTALFNRALEVVNEMNNRNVSDSFLGCSKLGIKNCNFKRNFYWSTSRTRFPCKYPVELTKRPAFCATRQRGRPKPREESALS